MPENTGTIAPLNWRALVDEALRRRKAERLTQREHAALASVSIPTIVAFDRGERTLSLAKAFDILRVVGLIEERGKEGAQEIFVKEAFTRWRSLIAKLPVESPGRFPKGWFRFDYALDGELREPPLSELEEIIQRSKIRLTGWPLFVSLNRPELAPREIDGVIECWVKPPETGVERNFADAAHCDFWRAAPSGRFFVMRGYQEDSQEAVSPGTIFDTTLPVWRLAEGLLHAARMAEALRAPNAEVSVRFRALYTGLLGRTLRSLQGHTFFLDETPARSDEAMLETVVPAEKIERTLEEIVYPLVSSLFERFSIANLSRDFVTAEITRFRSGRL